MRRTKEDAETSRRIILEAAYKVFLEKGYAATNLDDIARAIKMTRGVIYWHFKNKLDLFLCLINELLDDSIEKAGMIYKTEKPLPEKFRMFLSSDELRSPSLDLLRAFHPVAMELDPETREATLKVIRKKVQAGVDSFVDFISREQTAGNIRNDIDPEAFAATFMMIGGILHTPCNKNNSMPFFSIINNKREKIIDMLWSGLNSAFG